MNCILISSSKSCMRIYVEIMDCFLFHNVARLSYRINSSCGLMFICCVKFFMTILNNNNYNNI